MGAYFVPFLYKTLGYPHQRIVKVLAACSHAQVPTGQLVLFSRRGEKILIVSRAACEIFAAAYRNQRKGLGQAEPAEGWETCAVQSKPGRRVGDGRC
jgi:hypothetical protein